MGNRYLHPLNLLDKIPTSAKPINHKIDNISFIILIDNKKTKNNIKIKLEMYKMFKINSSLLFSIINLQVINCSNYYNSYNSYNPIKPDPKPDPVTSLYMVPLLVLLSIFLMFICSSISYYFYTVYRYNMILKNNNEKYNSLSLYNEL